MFKEGYEGKSFLLIYWFSLQGLGESPSYKNLNKIKRICEFAKKQIRYFTFFMAIHRR